MDTKFATTEAVLKALVIVPTYNEAASLPELLEALLGLPEALDILVVDDRSPDGTQELVEEHREFEHRVFLIPRPGKSGLASAYKEGFRWAKTHDYDVCLQMDGDLSHDPNDVPRLIQAIRDGADLAIGSRYVDGIRVLNWPASRLLLSLFAGAYTRCLAGLPLRDPTSGFKAIHRRVLEPMQWEELRAEGYGFQIELHFRAWQNGFQLREIPIVFTERRAGSSKMSHRIAWEAVWCVLGLALNRLKRRPRNSRTESAGRRKAFCLR